MAEMDRGPTEVWTRVLGAVALVCACAFLVTYVVVAMARMSYPYELEWLEGGTLDHVRRILAGHALYGAPSVEFTPFVYTPLYLVVSAGAAKLLGVGFLPLRLVSFVSSLGCFVVLFAWVRCETGSRAAGVMAAGLLAATYRLSGAWLDVGRVDSLFLLLLLGGVFVLHAGRGTGAHVVAGVLVALSFLTKQTALVVAIPLAAYCVAYERGWRRAVFPATVLLLIAATTFALDATTGGWYSYYVFSLPVGHVPTLGMAHMFWVHDIAVPLAAAFALAIVLLTTMLGKDDKRDGAFFALIFAGMVCASWFARMRVGGYNNALLPAYAGLSILFAMGVVRLAPGMFGRPGGVGSKSRGTLATYEALIAVLCVLQWAGLVYDPRAQVPTAADERAGDRLVRTLEGIDGDVFLPYHGYLASRAGKATFAQAYPVEGMLGVGDAGVYRAFQDSLSAAIRGGRFAAIILDAPWHLDDIEERYRFQGEWFSDDDDSFWPVTGTQVRPSYVYVLR